MRRSGNAALKVRPFIEAVFARRLTAEIDDDLRTGLVGAVGAGVACLRVDQ